MFWNPVKKCRKAKKTKIHFELKKEYIFKFKEEDYWAIYAPTHKLEDRIWTHASTRIYVFLLVVAVVSLFSLFLFYDNQSPMPYLYLGLAILVLGIAFTIKAVPWIKTRKKLNVYYESIKNGISITLDKASLQFKIGTSVTILPWSECKQTRIEEKYIHIELIGQPALLIPIGQHSRTLAKEFEIHISEISAEIWAKK